MFPCFPSQRNEKLISTDTEFDTKKHNKKFETGDDTLFSNSELAGPEVVHEADYPSGFLHHCIS